MNENLSINTDTLNTQVTNLPKWYTRLSAYLLDTLIFIPFSLLFIFLIPGNYVVPNQLVSLISGVLFSIYVAYFHNKEGATLGMRFVGIKITNTNGELLTFQNSLIRAMLVTVAPSLLSLIPILGGIISFVYLIALIVVILTDKSNQGFHDKQFNAIYSANEENTSRAKWIIGGYCGCFLPIIFGIIAAIFFGLGFITNSPLFNSDEKKESFMDTRMNKEDKMEPKNNSKKGDFYKSCVGANTNPNVDISEYCECAEKEYEKGKDLSEMVNACKDLINVGLE